MKKILVPIDFSKNASNALNYAAQFAKRTNARIYLLHVRFAPGMISTNPDVAIPSAEEQRAEGLLEVQKLVRKMKKRHQTLTITGDCVNGIPVDEIRIFAQQHKVDCIVMGAQGAGFLSERFLGSTATAVIEKAPCPVLTIDQKLKFNQIEKIVLASDFVETGERVLRPLKDLAQLFNARIYILNIVVDPIVTPTPQETINAYKVDRLLKNIHHTFYYLHHANVVEGINDFITEHKMDLLVMIPRKHSFFSRILSEPQTKKMAFHSKIPLLALHDTHL